MINVPCREGSRRPFSRTCPSRLVTTVACDLHPEISSFRMIMMMLMMRRRGKRRKIMLRTDDDDDDDGNDGDDDDEPGHGKVCH